jgi:hypothetical protein
VGQRRRVATAELKRERVLSGIEVEVPRHVAELQGTGRDHLGIEPGARSQQAQEIPAMPVGPVHHRRNTQSV